MREEYAHCAIICNLIAFEKLNMVESFDKSKPKKSCSCDLTLFSGLGGFHGSLKELYWGEEGFLISSSVYKIYMRQNYTLTSNSNLCKD